MTKIAGSETGSISQRHGSADPDPLVRGMDPWIRIYTKMSWIQNTGFLLLFRRTELKVANVTELASQNRKEEAETDLRAHRCRTSSGRCTSSRGWGPAPPSHMPPSTPPSCPSLGHQFHQLTTHTNLILSIFDDS
jgi:hypothetical protein